MLQKNRPLISLSDDRGITLQWFSKMRIFCDIQPEDVVVDVLEDNKGSMQSFAVLDGEVKKVVYHLASLLE